MLKTILLSFLIALISACGFQLRGVSSMPESLQRLAIEPNDPYFPLQREIRELLTYNGVTLVSTAQKPNAILYIKSDTFNTVDTGIGVDGRIREKSYTYSVTFSLKTPQGQILIEEQTISSQRIIEFNPDLALAQTMEAQIIEDETRTNVASQLVRRLSFAPEVPIKKAPKEALPTLI